MSCCEQQGKAAALAASNGHLDTVLFKALPVEYVHVAKQHPLHLLLPLASKSLSDSLVDSLPWIDGESLAPCITVGLHVDLNRVLSMHIAPATA